MANYIDRKVRRQVIGETRFRTVADPNMVKFEVIGNDLLLPDVVQPKVIHATDGDLYLMSEWGLAHMEVNSQGIKVVPVAELQDMGKEYDDIEVCALTFLSFFFTA